MVSVSGYSLRPNSFDTNVSAPSATQSATQSKGDGQSDMMMSGVGDLFDAMMMFGQAEIIGIQAGMSLRANEFNSALLDEDKFSIVKDGQNMISQYVTQVDQVFAKQDAIMNYLDIDSSFGTAATIKKESKLIKATNVMQMEEQARNKALGIDRQQRQMEMQALLGVQASKIQQQQLQATGVFKTVMGGAKIGMGAM